ncbi:hypothetical protein QBC46DRAFT_447641 [Diplogelasinospora grovesii]|uniref:Uncharacterized protein n=1 Tax=Diplogelasinospora grovesii TaxID=303347 RepID=A0AAN6NBE0_9PEZI|nr:hypothetical protein QBC46DRAFT_447641 [Diplogelasinospora grovesii]
MKRKATSPAKGRDSPGQGRGSPSGAPGPPGPSTTGNPPAQAPSTTGKPPAQAPSTTGELGSPDGAPGPLGGALGLPRFSTMGKLPAQASPALVRNIWVCCQCSILGYGNKAMWAEGPDAEEYCRFCETLRKNYRRCPNCQLYPRNNINSYKLPGNVDLYVKGTKTWERIK